MTNAAQIGKSIQVKGTVTADEPLTIAGSVEGSVTVKGCVLTITADGRVNADTIADTILVEGMAKGRLTASTRITLHGTASVTGEIHTPALSVAEGAKIQGRVDAGGRKSNGAASPAVMHS